LIYANELEKFISDNLINLIIYLSLSNHIIIVLSSVSVEDILIRL